MIIVNGMHILTNRRTNLAVALTRAELDRFFDNRDPRDWIV